jgi:serine/threonine-protein kinase RsbW
MSANRGNKNTRRILGRVSADEFVGRAAELERLVRHPRLSGTGRGLLLLMSPVAGVSELLRQGYDELFNQQEDIVPILFTFTRNETTAVSAAIEFLNTFLLQYVAFSRNEPALTLASLTLNDLAELAPARDLDWIQELIAGFDRERFNKDDRALVKFCFSAPQRVPAHHARPFVMIDAAQFVEHFNGDGRFGAEILRALCPASLPFAVAGLRRQLLAAAHRANCDFAALDILRLGPLGNEDATRLVEQLALRHQVRITDETRDLLLQQLAATPFFVKTLLQAARERNLALETYVACEQLYVDELMGGRIGRHFASVLEEIAPQPETRRALLRLLFEGDGGGNKSSFGAWRKRLEIEPAELERMLHGLHVHEFVNWDGAMVEVLGGPPCWSDYLESRFRLDINGEPRALVVAELLANVLKRAPQNMARHYRRSSTLGLRELLASFDCQSVPEILLDYQEFSAKYKGADLEEIASGLESETSLIKLPQVIHVATGQSFAPQLKDVCDAERCVVAHAFADATYSDEQQIVWLVAEIDSKLEAGKGPAKEWCALLESVAKKNGFKQTRIWLIANEGFTDEAVDVLSSSRAYGSSRAQLELLTAHLNIAPTKPVAESDEFVMILPMGEDNELVAANTVEQIARRLNFGPEAINQIKTAIVEACINAAEHSFSPDRKIYQRFRVESDRLTITIASRGVTPANNSAAAADDSTRERRGWGLKLIRTLMDEVEFESVDDGTSLRMTKYVRKN